MSIKRTFAQRTPILIKFFIFLILIPIISFIIVPKHLNASNEFIDITAEAAIIMDYDSGKILWEKNSSEKLYPASTTKLMNEKAREIGALDTFFQNTNGLDTKYPEHKTTAKDLAIIAKYCMNNELFRKIISIKNDYIIINDEKVDIFNTNILLFFDYIKGIKIGVTENAGHCLVLYSERQGLKLITVVLKSEDNKREADMLKLIDWANDNYSNKNIVNSGKLYKTIKIRNSPSEVSL